MPMGLLGFFFIINLKSMCLFDVFVFRLVSMSFFFDVVVYKLTMLGNSRTSGIRSF